MNTDQVHDTKPDLHVTRVPVRHGDGYANRVRVLHGPSGHIVEVTLYPMQVHNCAKCGTQPAGQFYPRSAPPDYRQGYCKPCAADYKRVRQTTTRPDQAAEAQHVVDSETRT